MLLRPNVLRGVSDAASTDPSRYQLGGIFLERDGSDHARATATDGKLLISSRWREEDPTEFPGPATCKEGFSAIMPAAAARDVARAIPTARQVGPRPILMRAAVDEISANGTLPVTVTDLSTTRRVDVPAIEGAYPNYQNAFPMTAPTFTMRMNPALLRDLCDALVKIHPGEPARGKEKATGPDCAVVEFYAPDRPLVFRLKSKAGDVETVGLAMPLVLETKVKA